jgi:hypothetical protein
MVAAVEPVLPVLGEHQVQEDHQVQEVPVLHTQLTAHQHILLVVAVADKVVVHGTVAVVLVAEAVTVQEQTILVVEEVMIEVVQALLSSVIQEIKELQVEL